tara:strand:- start:1375 stop:1593 length:219 start_codon:yes stop_codon:yes gene_type:complete
MSHCWSDKTSDEYCEKYKKDGSLDRRYKHDWILLEAEEYHHRGYVPHPENVLISALLECVKCGKRYRAESSI